MRIALIASWLLFALTWTVPLHADWNIYGAPSGWVRQERSGEGYSHPYDHQTNREPCK